MKKLFRKCGICGNEYGTILHYLKFAEVKNCRLPASYDIVVCERCGFVFADTTATQQDYDEYYNQFSKYEDMNLSSGSGTADWDRERLERTACDIEKYLQNKNAAILDLGCANGGLLKVLSEKGYDNLMGIDPSPACVANVKGQGIHALTGDIFSDVFEKHNSIAGFDCIILSHVLEHVYNIHEAADRLFNMLNREGLLYVEVPDASIYADYYVVPFYYFDCEHINHFDEHSLSNLLKKFSMKCLCEAKKDFLVSPTQKYPSVFVIYQKINNDEADGQAVKNLNVYNSVIKYIELSVQKSDWLKIQALADTREPVFVWGAGQFTMRLLENSSLNSCNIIGFIDNDKSKCGKYINNIMIHSPDYIKTRDAPIIICSALYADQIAAQIRDMGTKNPFYIIR